MLFSVVNISLIFKCHFRTPQRARFSRSSERTRAVCGRCARFPGRPVRGVRRASLVPVAMTVLEDTELNVVDDRMALMAIQV